MYENNPDSWTSALVAVSGSVAAVKAPEIVARLLNAGVSVDLVLTESAYKLMQATYNNEKPWERLKALQVDRCVTPTMKPTLRIYRDADEWSAYNTVGDDPVLHIELAKRNKLLLIAPLCANTLAHAALGLCGNLVGSVLRAWYYDLEEAFAGPMAERYGQHALNRPVLVAPAMNTFMWHQNITKQHMATLESRGVHVALGLVVQRASGLVEDQDRRVREDRPGDGAMAEVADIHEQALGLLRAHAAAEAEAEKAGKPAFVP